MNYKKIISLSILFILSLILTACTTGSSRIELDITDLDHLALINYDQSTDLILPDKGKNGSSITWESSDPYLITTEGIILPPNKLEGKKSVTLTATLSSGFSKEIHDLTLTVLPYNNPTAISEEKQVPFENLTTEYTLKNSSIKTYFLDNGNIPYINIEETFNSLDGLIYSSELEYVYYNNSLVISYDIENDNESYVYSVTLDNETQIISSSSLDFFNNYFYQTGTNFSKNLEVVNYDRTGGENIIFDLNYYRLSLYKSDNNFYIPLHLFNLLFISDSYFNLYYNYDTYYGIYSIPDKQTKTQLSSSSMNNEEIPFDIVRLNYDFYAFTFDYLYGIKKSESFYELSKPYLSNLLSRDAKNSSEGIFTYINKYLDELHSSYDHDSYYTPRNYQTSLTSLNQLGTRTQQWYQTLFTVESLQKYRNENYRMLDNETAVIYLDSFDTKSSEDAEEKDSDDYMNQTLTTILSLYPKTKNIIIDISYNTGGNLGALLRVLGYMTDKNINLSYQNPLENSNETYEYKITSPLRPQVNWYILTSKVTFSAANLMASIAKEQKLATLIGTQSGGGASSIIPIVSPTGTIFHMSSLNVLSYRVKSNDTYQYFDIENGVTPDYLLNVNKLNDANSILNIIKNNSNS